MKSILTFLLIILMDIQLNYACPCSPTNTFIEMNESFASQFQTATIIPMFLCSYGNRHGLILLRAWQ